MSGAALRGAITRQITRLLFIGGLGLGPIIVLFALSSTFPLSLALMAVLGTVLQIFMTSNITLMQMAAPDYIRGRVMGIRYITMGTGTLGILLLGVGAEVLGPAVALALMGLFALVLVILILVAITALRQIREPTGVSGAQI